MRPAKLLLALAISTLFVLAVAACDQHPPIGPTSVGRVGEGVDAGPADAAAANAPR